MSVLRNIRRLSHQHCDMGREITGSAMDRSPKSKITLKILVCIGHLINSNV